MSKLPFTLFSIIDSFKSQLNRLDPPQMGEWKRTVAVKSSFSLMMLLLTSCQGQDANKALIKELKEKVADAMYPNIDGILVEQGSSILLETYFNGFERDSLHDTRSSFKSITSLLAGIAIDRKMISLEDSIRRFFPELEDSNKGAITVKNLLEMK